MSLLKDLVYASSRAKIAIDRSESSSLNVDGIRAIRESSKIINMLDTAEMDYDFNIKQDCRPVKEFKISYLLKMN